MAVGGANAKGVPRAGVSAAVGTGDAVGGTWLGGVIGVGGALAAAGLAESAAGGATTVVAGTIGTGDAAGCSGAPAQPAKTSNAASVKACSRSGWPNVAVFILSVLS